MGIDGINKTDGRLAWPETRQEKAAPPGEKTELDSGLDAKQRQAGDNPAQSLGVWRKNGLNDQDGRLFDSREAQDLLTSTAKGIAQTPKNQLTGLQDVIDRYWINPEYY